MNWSYVDVQFWVLLAWMLITGYVLADLLCRVRKLESKKELKV